MAPQISMYSKSKALQALELLNIGNGNFLLNIGNGNFFYFAKGQTFQHSSQLLIEMKGNCLCNTTNLSFDT